VGEGGAFRRRLWHGAIVSGTGQPAKATAGPEKLDQWHDFRKNVALVSVVLFFFCLVGLGFLAYQLVIVGDDGIFDPWSSFRTISVTVPLGTAAVMGVGVYRAANNGESKRRGRIMALALLVATVLLVVTGIIGDRLP
jgi:hypothetical protein